VLGSQGALHHGQQVGEFVAGGGRVAVQAGPAGVLAADAQGVGVGEAEDAGEIGLEEQPGLQAEGRVRSGSS
jgi:hypothetical protein